VETAVAQGGAADHPNREVQATEPRSSATSPNQSQVEDDYSIAYDHPRREIKKPSRYVDSEGLVAYAFIAVEEIPEGAKPLNYTEAISYPSSSN